jgi:Na+/H+ antiporter NhaC
MSFAAAGLVPLLSVTAAGGVPTQSFMPFALLLVPVVMVALLLLVFGRQRRKSRHDHEE